jgi:hypothetical protein
MQEDAKTYRSRLRGQAATFLSLIVALATVGGGYVVTNALNIDGAPQASPMFPVTRDVVQRSIGEVLDARLAEDRLKAMLGVAASAEKEQQTELAKIANQAGKPVEAPPAGPDYALKLFKSRSADLADELASAVDLAKVNDLKRCLAADQVTATHASRTDAQDRPPCLEGRDADLKIIRDEMRTRVERAVSPVAADGQAPAPRDAIKEWAETVAADAGVVRAWRDGKYSTGASEFLLGAVDRATLPDAIAKGVASAVSVYTVDADAVAPAARSLGARLTWGVTAILFIGLWCAAILVAGWQVWTLLPPGRAGPALALGLAVAIAAGAATYVMAARGPETFSLLGPLLFRLEEEAGTHIVGLSRLFGAMTATAVVLLLLAACAATWNATKDSVRVHLEGVRTIFNVAAALLVAQSIQIAALYTWPAAALEHAQASTGPLGTAALLTAGMAGALFSVALMIVYLPAVSVLRAVARENDTGEAETLLQEQGVNDSGMQWILRLLQALSPLLAAVPISGLLTFLGE